MKKSYAAIIGKEEGDKRFGIVFPDFPGCVTSVENPEDRIPMAVEALTLHVGG